MQCTQILFDNWDIWQTQRDSCSLYKNKYDEAQINKHVYLCVNVSHIDKNCAPEK